MSQINAIGFSAIFSLIAGLLITLGSQAYAGHHEGKGHGMDKGPCAEIECEKGDKFCYQKKKECMTKHFEKKLDEAKAKGVTAEEKAKWVEKIQKKIAYKKERVSDMQSKITEMEAHLKSVQALKTK